MSAEPPAKLRFPGAAASIPLPPAEVRWGVTLAAVAVAAAAAFLLAARTRAADAAAEGASLYASGKPDRAYPYLAAAARGTWLQAKPCLDLGDLAVWTIDDGAFQHYYRFEDARPLVRLAFLSYAEALRRQPGSSRAWAGLAEIFKKERVVRIKESPLNLDTLDETAPPGGEDEDRLVVEAYRRAIRLEPNNYFYYAYLGDFYDERGLRDDALASYAKAVEIMPDLSWHYYVPEHDIPADLYASTRAALESAAVTNPLFPRERIWLNLATLAERARDPNTAIESYRKAIDLASDPSPYLQILGALYFDLRRYDDAERTLNEALARDTLQPQTKGVVYAILGRCAMVRNDNRGAVEYLKQARWLNPNGSFISIELGQVYEALGMLDKAESEYQAAIRSEPAKASVYAALIAMYRRTHQINKAIALASRLVEMFPDNEIFREQLRSLNREMGRPEEG